MTTHILKCELCRQVKSTFFVVLGQNVSWLIRRRYTRFSGYVCYDCLQYKYHEFQAATLEGTWWGCIGFIIGPFLLISNLFQYIKASNALLFDEQRNGKEKRVLTRKERAILYFCARENNAHSIYKKELVEDSALEAFNIRPKAKQIFLSESLINIVKSIKSKTGILLLLFLVVVITAAHMFRYQSLGRGHFFDRWKHSFCIEDIDENQKLFLNCAN